jgi:hypothetical protein
MRWRAIRDALWYDCSYQRHLAENLSLAWRWLTFGETREDIAFAREHLPWWHPDRLRPHIAGVRAQRRHTAS